MDNPKLGYIYILINPAFNDGVSRADHGAFLKIGQSTKDPRIRAEQLSASSGVMLPFQVAYYRQVNDANLAERQIHGALDQYRVNNSREFFLLPLAEAIIVLDQIADGVLPYEDYETPFAELFASFPPQVEGSVFENNLTPAEVAACRQLAQVRPFRSRPYYLNYR